MVKMYVEKEHMKDMECDECANDVTYRIYLKEGVLYLCDSCRKELIKHLANEACDRNDEALKQLED
jgi:hypothetical protein